MRTIVLDFETYYDDVYNLKKMTPVEYILNPKFEVIGAGIVSNYLSGWLNPEQLKELFSYLRGLRENTGEKIAVVSHNSLFDMCIAAWHFGYVPDLMIDTLGMARAWLGWGLKSFSLASVGQFLGLPSKGNVLMKAKGMRRADIEAAPWWGEYKHYGVNDAEICNGIYRKIVDDGFPASEIIVLDTVLRCGVLPKFVLDEAVLSEHLHVIKQEKLNLLARCQHDRSDLMSNEKFANILRSFGVEPPTKISMRTGKETYAFSKDDEGFIELEEHENENVQTVVAARLGLKSTIEETRTERFLNIANLPWPNFPKITQGVTYGLMPIPLKYSGAHTHRLSGEWKLNLQNLKRGSRIRDSLRAPDGKRVISADASQIEARLVAWFANEVSLIETFRNRGDPYLSFAEQAFGRKLTREGNPIERYIGKTCILGMGYGIGWPKFLTTIRAKSKSELGVMLEMDELEAQRLVAVYRSTYANISRIWQVLNQMIPEMTKEDCAYELGPITFAHERIKLPNGMYLYYHELENLDGEWVFTYNDTRKRIYGGKLLENIIQALARICTMDAATRMRRRFTHGGYRLDLALQCHDELVYVEPEERADEICDALKEEMCVSPTWAPDLPLGAEAGHGTTYGNAKD